MLVNAGPTHEKIDPVRFIGNYSTGKMGYAIASEARKRQADVILVSGPVESVRKPDSQNVISVVSAEEMARETIANFKTCDIAILTAAVADYTPFISSGSKLKKNDEDMVIRLKPTKDIAAELGKMKNKNQLLIGFALETDDELKNASNKLKKKNLDLIVMNSLRDDKSGFGYDTNKVTLIDRDNNITTIELKTKTAIAVDILNKIEEMI